MKKLFRGYYKLTEQEIQEIWEQGFISLDTNVLFNIYRYSEETRKELLKVIRKYSSQLWLTYHSAYEFHKNRIAVISEQVGIYEKTIKTFTELENDIIKNLKTPHLSKKALQTFEKTIKETVKDLEGKKDYYKKLLVNDKILHSITSIFNNKVGEPFTSEEITKIEKEGEERYKKKIPPGYKDNEKKENKFGDLIIWKELLRKSKADNKPFILIIDDVKEDWWLRANGQTISARQELSQEMFVETNQLFHLYTPDRFLEFASKTEDIKQEAIDEVREIRIDGDTSFFKSDVFKNEIFPNSNLSGIWSANETLKKLSQTDQFANLLNSTKFSTTLSDLAKNSEFIKNLDTLQKFNDLQSSLSNLPQSIRGGLMHSLLPDTKFYQSSELKKDSETNTDTPKE